jgi:hypothetical protein
LEELVVGSAHYGRPLNPQGYKVPEWARGWQVGTVPGQFTDSERGLFGGRSGPLLQLLQLVLQLSPRLCIFPSGDRRVRISIELKQILAQGWIDWIRTLARKLVD